ncbi:MAG: hypothetical protein B7Y43_14305 [Sphingomonas sp. 28-62-20]|nr:MAG: hypothetical protein B7Y43_14305 [Sphingomonas sp. 28-62-20]
MAEHQRAELSAAFKVKAISLIIVVALVLLYWWTFNDESRAESRYRLAQSAAPDIIPSAPIALHGDIRVIGIAGDGEPVDRSDRDERGNVRRYREGCDALCAALLAMPAVRSVTVVSLDLFKEAPKPGAGTRFRLVPRAQCSAPTVLPQNPDALRDPADAAAARRLEERAWPGNVAGNPKWTAVFLQRQSLATEWALRLSTRDCIIAEPPKPHADFTIGKYVYERFGRSPPSYEWNWSFDALPVTASLLQVTDGQGRIRFRQTHASTLMLIRPLLPGLVGFVSYATPVFGWLRTPLINDSADREIDDNSRLLKYTTLTPTKITGQSIPLVKARLIELVGNRSAPASDPAFGLVDGWMQSLGLATVQDDDRKLLVDLIKDKRVTQFQSIDDAIVHFGDDLTVLHAPILRRIAADGANREVVQPLAAQLYRLPDRSPAIIALEDAILKDPKKRRYADGLIVQQADRGAAAVPLLIRIIREHAERSQIAREQAINNHPDQEIEPIAAARIALCRIGPAAIGAVDALREMMANDLLPERTLDDINWKVMLARIGTPLHEITKPSSRGQITEAKFQERLGKNMVDFDVRRGCDVSSV